MWCHRLGKLQDRWWREMLETDQGWLQIYHGVDQHQRYCLGALLLDIDCPTIIRGRLRRRWLNPSKPM